MKWKDLKMQWKFTLAFGSVILLLVVVAGWSIFGVQEIVTDAHEVISSNRLRSNLEEKYKQHLIWTKALSDYLTSDGSKEFDLETDPTQCAWGKWYYGEDRKEAERLVPGLAPILEKVEAPHKHLHESAIDIQACFEYADYALSNELQAAKAEHLIMLNKLLKGIQDGKPLDPASFSLEQCSFYKWQQGEEVQKVLGLYPEVEILFAMVFDLHESYHSSLLQTAQKISSNPNAALASFNSSTQPLLDDFLGKAEALISFNNLHLEGMQEANRIFKEETQPNLAELETYFQDMIAESKSGLMNEDLMLNAANNTQYGVFIFAIVSLLLAIGLAILITRNISLPLKKGINYAQTVAEGDLVSDVSIKQNDEIGQLAEALRQMSAKLATIVEQIIEGADNINSSSEQMSSAAQQISNGANQQASSVEEVSASMEEMSANIDQNSESAKATEELTLSANKRIKDSNDATQRLVEAMNRIAEKITVVNDIAFQTNILALNAAVEAARAGEHGRGFAVVAAEVRKLAEHSKQAAEEIVSVSNEGKTIANDAGQQLSSILPDMDRITQLIQEIAMASIEQSSGANQVNDGIQQLSTVTQRNAASAEEMATSAEEFAAQANQLRLAIDFFKIKNTASAKSQQSIPLEQENNIQDRDETKTSEISKKEMSIELSGNENSDSDFESF